MRAIVTGGAGFVGSNLVRAIYKRHGKDAAVMVIDDLRSGDFTNLCAADDPADPFTFTGSFIARTLGELDVHSVVEEFEPDVVFHLASITDTRVAEQAKMIADNLEPFEQLLDAAVEKGFKLVYASSAATYGRTARGAATEKRPFALHDAGDPANVYGFSKWLMEKAADETLERSPEAHVVGLRYFNVFGPREAHKGPMASMIYQLTQQVLAGKTPRLFHDGSQARDQVYVHDVVDCTLAAADDDARSGVYNVGSGVATSFNDIAAAISTALGAPSQVEYFDNPFAFYQSYTCADLAKTKKHLKWSPRYHPREAIAEYAQHLKAQHTRR